MLSFVTFCIAFFIGIWGFAQIVGTFQNLGVFRPSYSAYLLVIWTIILSAVYFLLKHFIPSAIGGTNWGYIISLIVILCSGRIR